MDGHPYRIVPARLVQIEGVDYVRCPLHGLIPLDHHCTKSPIDHWCREAAHPANDPTLGVDGLDDQGVSHDEWGRILLAQRDYWHKVAQRAAEALALADQYLDGFLWLDDPEASELEAIKRASKVAQKRVAGPMQGPKGISQKALDLVRGSSQPDG